MQLAAPSLTHSVAMEYRIRFVAGGEKERKRRRKRKTIFLEEDERKAFLRQLFWGDDCGWFYPKVIILKCRNLCKKIQNIEEILSKNPAIKKESFRNGVKFIWKSNIF